MEFVTFLWLFGICTTDVQASTHWIVTETGLVQSKQDSPFEMARPYDLVAFLNQDTRWDNILQLYNDLSIHQHSINQLWAELKDDTNIKLWLNKNFHCKQTGALSFLDWYSTHLEDGLSKNIPQEEYQVYSPSFGEDIDVPDCKKISSLTFSMSTFEHLESIVNRYNLTMNAEMSLPEIIAQLMTVEQFGHWVATSLRANSSSWLHYNMAALYWRVKGNAPKAMECVRRAVHYAPREYKDIALLNMGTILHRTKRHEDSVIVLTAAIDHDPGCAEAHFILGHAYAILADFNRSALHYEETLKLNRGYDQAEKNRHGVLCIAELVKKLKVVHSKLTRLKSNLTEYAAMEMAWLQLQVAFLRSKKHNEEFDFNNVEKIVKKMAKMTGQNINHLKKDGDRNSVMLHILNSSSYQESWFNETGLLAVETAFNLQKLVNHISKHVEKASGFIIKPELLKLSEGKIKKEYGPMPILSDIGTPDGTNTEPLVLTPPQSQFAGNPDKPGDGTYQYEMGYPLYPPTLKISRSIEDFDRDPNWPSDKVCKESPSFPDIEVIHPVFLPFENKGLRLKGILTDHIGVSLHTEHDLPWHPPACPAGKEMATLQKKLQKQQVLPEIAQTNILRQKLLEYVGDGYPDQAGHMQEAEIGQRIYTAMHSEVTPKWLVYTLASLYWRVRNNNINALTCLIAASKHVRSKYKDVVLTSLSSVYLETGFLDEAWAAAEEAYKLGIYEPATNFLIAQLNMVKKQRMPQMFHLKQTVRVESGFMRGMARKLLISWGCLLKQVDALQGLDLSEGDVCTEVSPGVSMVCNKNNVNCHVANIQCFTHNEKESTSTFVRLMRINEDPSNYQADFMDQSAFEPFIQHMPLERTDLEGHAEHFQKMIDFLDNLKGCGPRGCRSIKPEDLALKEEDCSYQYLQLGYWLHIISFRQLLTEDDIRLPPEVVSMVPTAKSPKTPECRIYGDPSQDFFLQRLFRVDTDGWEPDISLMHQFSEMFNGQEYSILGAKFAKYIEMHGRSWSGLLGGGWWCGAGGAGQCAVRCLSASYARAPHHLQIHALRSLVAMLHMQGKTADAKDIALLTFYLSPKSKTEAFLVAVSNSYLEQYEQAVWMYRYALTFDDKYLPAKACLHATMCMMLYGADKTKPSRTDDDAEM